MGHVWAISTQFRPSRSRFPLGLPHPRQSSQHPARGRGYVHTRSDKPGKLGAHIGPACDESLMAQGPKPSLPSTSRSSAGDMGRKDRHLGRRPGRSAARGEIFLEDVRPVVRDLRRCQPLQVVRTRVGVARACHDFCEAPDSGGDRYRIREQH